MSNMHLNKDNNMITLSTVTLLSIFFLFVFPGREFVRSRQR